MQGGPPPTKKKEEKKKKEKLHSKVKQKTCWATRASDFFRQMMMYRLHGDRLPGCVY
jgi:hypothetical protein